MPEAVPDIHRELQLAEAQAAELWRQAEQVCAAYRAAVLRVDQLREQLQRSDQREEPRETVGANSR